MATKKITPKKVNTQSTTQPAATPFITEDAASAYKYMLPRVQAIPADRLQFCRAEPVVCHVNVKRGVAAVKPHEARIRAEMPKVSVKDLFELPALALGLIFAAGRVAKMASAGEIDDRYAKLRDLRAPTLQQLDVFAWAGLVPRDRVRAIHRGKGMLDSARDGVAIAGVFEEFAPAVTGKHPFSREQIAELAEHGNWLIQNLNPSGAKPAPAVRDEAAIVRDRFWTALSEGYPMLRRVGIYLFGEEEVDLHVPPLQARVAVSAPAVADGSATNGTPANGGLKLTPVGPDVVAASPGPATK